MVCLSCPIPYIADKALLQSIISIQSIFNHFSDLDIFRATGKTIMPSLLFKRLEWPKKMKKVLNSKTLKNYEWKHQNAVQVFPRGLVHWKLTSRMQDVLLGMKLRKSDRNPNPAFSNFPEQFLIILSCSPSPLRHKGHPLLPRPLQLPGPAAPAYCTGGNLLNQLSQDHPPP